MHFSIPILIYFFFKSNLYDLINKRQILEFKYFKTIFNEQNFFMN